MSLRFPLTLSLYPSIPFPQGKGRDPKGGKEGARRGKFRGREGVGGANQAHHPTDLRSAAVGAEEAGPPPPTPPTRSKPKGWGLQRPGRVRLVQRPLSLFFLAEEAGPLREGGAFKGQGAFGSFKGQSSLTLTQLNVHSSPLTAADQGQNHQLLRLCRCVACTRSPPQRRSVMVCRRAAADRGGGGEGAAAESEGGGGGREGGGEVEVTSLFFWAELEKLVDIKKANVLLEVESTARAHIFRELLVRAMVSVSWEQASCGTTVTMRCPL